MICGSQGCVYRHEASGDVSRLSKNTAFSCTKHGQNRSKTSGKGVKMARFQFGRWEKQIIREIANGRKVAAVARDFGLHRCTIHRWFQREEVQQYYEQQKLFAEAKALRELEKQLEDPNPLVALRASKKIMDKMLGKPKKPEVTIVFVNGK